MKYVLIVLGLIVFSMIGTSFAIIPVYYSEDKCDMDEDLQNYREILQDDIVVKTFLQKYPNAISIPAIGIDDSDPPQTSVHYLYEDDTAFAQLTILILGHGVKLDDCFVPFSYTLNYQNNSKTSQIINYAVDTQELRDFLNNAPQSSSITHDDLLNNYENNDLIIEGKVISLDSTQNQTKYDIQVEHYYKNQKQSKLISAFTLSEDSQQSVFQKDDRVVLYIKQEKGKYLIQNPSFKVDYECNSGIWGSFLAPSYNDILMRRSPATGNFPEFSEPDGANGLYKAGKEMQITYNVENYGPMIKFATVNFSVSLNQKVIFTDERRITVPACSGRVPLNWNFTPQSGDYSVKVNVSGTYKVHDKSFQFSEPRVENIFQSRQNWAGGSIDRMTYPISEPDYSIYSLKYKHHEYFIPYQLSGASLEKMELSCETSSLLVQLQNAEGGSLTVNLARKMLSSKAGEGDSNFIILVDREEAHFKEIDSNSDSRILEISFGKDAKLIEIIATQWVTQMPYPKTCGTAELEESPYYKLLSPLEQYHNGIEASQVKCKEDFTLLKKANSGLPICVRFETGFKLLERKLVEPTIFGLASESLPVPEDLVNIDRIHISKIVLPLGLSGVGNKITPEPQSITLVIGVNNTIVWENQGDVPVTLVSTLAYHAWTTGVIKPGQSKIMTFNDTGIHGYHGSPGPWIQGTITVKEK